MSYADQASSSATVTNLEPLVVRTASTFQPVVGTWSFPRDAGLDVAGASRITLINASTTDLRVRLDDVVADLPGKDVLTLGLEAGRKQIVTFEAPNGGDADGSFVLHDTISDWRLDSPGDRQETPFQGPLGLVLVNHPSSAFTVQWLAGGGLRARVAPDEAIGSSFTDAEARSMAVQGPNVGAGTAKGLYLGLLDD
ncbi:MAG: hypothetical protein AAGD38_24255 [Acidobacteriota bacterium]